MDEPASREETWTLHPDLRIIPAGASGVQLDIGSEHLHVADDFLPLLLRFNRGASIEEAMQTVPRVSGAFIRARQEIEEWKLSGVLVSDVGEGSVKDVGFSSVRSHLVMLNDVTRTRAFIDALHRNVRKGDVVVDLGCGSGVLSVAAARAGAARVHAIGSGGMADVAQRVFEGNGVADLVRLHRGRSEGFQLEEPADLLVTETLGNDPFGEGILQNVIDARKRFLKPDARIIPSRVRVVMEVRDMSESHARGAWLEESHLDRWRDAYGMDLAPLQRLQLKHRTAVAVSPEVVAGWKPLCAPTEVSTVDLAALDRDLIKAEVELESMDSGRRAVMVVSFRCDLDEHGRLSTVPGEAPSDNHWKCLVWAPQVIGVERGDRIRLVYRSNGDFEMSLP